MSKSKQSKQKQRKDFDEEGQHHDYRIRKRGEWEEKIVERALKNKDYQSLLQDDAS